MSEALNDETKYYRHPTRPDVVQAARDALYKDSASVDEFARAKGNGHRWVRRMIAAGMPHFQIGRETRIPIPEAPEWLRKFGTPDREPRNRGRQATKGR